MNQIVKAERQAVIDPIPVLDSSIFEHMQRIANVMAKSSLVPDALCKVKVGTQMVDLSAEQVFANCFLVVNQSVRWGLDPFGVAQCVSVVHGKLCYEGKLVAAVLEAKLAVRLHHHFVGAPGNDDYRIYLSDRPFDTKVGDKLLRDVVQPGMSLPGFRIIDGSVGEWKTTGNNSPWSPKNHPRMLIYRGTRDWTRIYEPAVMLGVYTQDEMLDLAENARALRARDVSKPSLAERLAAANQGGVETALLRAAEAVEHDAETGEVTETTTQSSDSLAASASDDGRHDNGSVAATQSQAKASEDNGGTSATEGAPTAGEVSRSTSATATGEAASTGAATNPGATGSSVGADKPPAEQAKSAGGPPTREEAYALGRKFKVEGRLKSKCPKEIRNSDELFEAFLEGHDEAPTDD